MPQLVLNASGFPDNRICSMASEFLRICTVSDPGADSLMTMPAVAQSRIHPFIYPASADSEAGGDAGDGISTPCPSLHYGVTNRHKVHFQPRAAANVGDTLLLAVYLRCSSHPIHELLGVGE